ncbi:MAG: PEP-CTERM sorting domain-containing protein [Aquabacterium sp.]|nr:PEP-CTERM sorting domain-containing protein [Aquabacterium sp.]
MKNLFALAAIAAAAMAPAHALTTGDIAFTAFNADEDGWSLVTFVDIAPNTRIYFSDSTATGATTIGTGESSFLWGTGASMITAGTVVRFSAIDVAARAASIGSFSAVGTGNLGLSATAETVYAFLGSSATAVTTMLSAVSSEASTTALTTVGLTAGTNAIKLTSSADFAGYTGARSGDVSFAAYAPLVNNAANWAINVGGNGTLLLPDTTNFTISPIPEPETYALMLAGLAAIGLMAHRRQP